MATTKPATPKDAGTSAFDPDKRYAISLKRVVEHEGFTFRPGGNPIEVTGAFANSIAGAIAEASEIPPLPESPPAPTQIHELADGSTIVVNPA